MAPTQPPGRIETLNGTQLYFEVHGSGEPVVLLHGFSGSSQDWTSTLAEWRAHFQLIVPDMRGHRASVPEQQREMLRRRHPGGDAQIEALLASTEAFAASYDDMSFTPPHLATIRARTLIVQGDRDPLYPVELSVEMAKAIPESSLWIVPDGGHGPVIGERWPEFIEAAGAFLRK